ncbi:MAG TPA: TlpA disulfide reductase family protein [Bacteroidia bacterium]
MSSGKKVGLFLLLLAAGLVGLFLYKKYKIAPDLPIMQQELYTENGEKTTLSGRKGKPMIISYYASWCGDCLKEMKELNAVKDTALANIEVICITDEPAEKLTSFKNKHMYPFSFYRIAKRFNEIGIYTIPVTYLINSKGEMVYNKVGAIRWKDPSFIQYAKKQLN